MATKIITKNGSGVPANGQLDTGELAVDLTNKKLYSSTDGLDIVEISPAASIVVSVKDYGATGDGVTDDSTAIQAAIDSVGSSGSVWFPKGVYSCSSINLTCDLDMDVGALLLNNQTSYGYVIRIDVANLKIGRLFISGNNQECTCLDLTANANKCYFEFVKIQNVKALVGQASTSNAAIRIAGDYNIFDSISYLDLVNDGTSNGSFPQALATITDAHENKAESITAYNCRSVVVHASTGALYVDSLHSSYSYDNGVYQLSGTLVVGNVYHTSAVQEEAVVLKGGKANIGNITLYGNGTAVGFDAIDYAHIGEIVSIPDGTGDTNSWFFRVRNTATTNGRIHIGKLSGTLRGAGLWYAGNGVYPNAEIEYLTIDGGDVTFEYDSAICTDPSTFMDIQACHGFSIRDLNVRIVDINNALTTPITYFYMKAPIAVDLEKPSYVANVDVYIVQSDAITLVDIANANWRGQYFAQAAIYSNDVVWQANTGPYLREVAYSNGTKNSASTTPTVGTWRKGQDFILLDATTAPFRTRCTVSGTPGTWVDY